MKAREKMYYVALGMIVLWALAKAGIELYYRGYDRGYDHAVRVMSAPTEKP